MFAPARMRRQKFNPHIVLSRPGLPRAVVCLNMSKIDFVFRHGKDRHKKNALQSLGTRSVSIFGKSAKFR